MHAAIGLKGRNAMPQFSPTPPTSTPVRRSRLAKADRPLYEALHRTPGADLRWHLRRDRGLSDAELRAAMAEEGPYDGLISDTTLARVRRVLKIPRAPEALSPTSTTRIAAGNLCNPCSPSPSPPERRPPDDTNDHAPYPSAPLPGDPPAGLHAPDPTRRRTLGSLLRGPRPSRRGPPPAPGHPLGAHRGPGEGQPRLLPTR
jgi:hypothetical protein